MIVVASVLYIPCLGCAKFSLLLLYRKLSHTRWCEISTYILMATVLSYSVGIIFALIFPCHPIAANVRDDQARRWGANSDISIVGSERRGWWLCQQDWNLLCYCCCQRCDGFSHFGTASADGIKSYYLEEKENGYGCYLHCGLSASHLSMHRICTEAKH